MRVRPAFRDPRRAWRRGACWTSHGWWRRRDTGPAVVPGAWSSRW